MAAPDRTATPPVIGDLLESGRYYAFFQAVRLLERLHPDAAPVGEQGPVEEEAMRFRAHATLCFPISDIQKVERKAREDENPRYDLEVNFLGLYGPASPLPAFYTEDIISAERDDTSVREFLDLFHHRLVGLFYRTWKKYRYYIQYREAASDVFSSRMFCLIGLGDARLRESTHVEWARLLTYAGMLAMRSRSASLVTRVLSHYFRGLAVGVEQCVERWVTIEPRQRNRLGLANVSLGRDMNLGERVRDRSGKFRLVLGPLDFPTFQSHLPPGEHHRTLRELVRFILKDQLDFDVKLVLRQPEIPDLTLAADSPCRLGWSTWLGRHRDEDGEVILKG
jgi:type VI secretion system protein ImpH